MASENGSQSSYDPNALGQTFGKKLTEAVNTKAPVFGQNMFVEPSAATTGGLAQLSATASNPAYSNGVQGSINDFADIAAGKRFGTNDPGFAALRSKLSNDVLTQTNSAFNNSGLFGSDSNQKAAAEGLGNALAGLDYGNFQNDQQRQVTAAGLLPGLYQAGQLPAQTLLGAGQAQDAIATARRAGEADLFDRTNNADYNRLLQTLGAFTGSQQNAGMKEPVPLWQQLLGGAATTAGIFGSFL